MTDSQQLLADYIKNGSERAFEELVKRYIDLVYSTARRLVGSGHEHLAEDVTQMVFVNLARKAHTLSPDAALGGWLHRDTCFAAARIMRGERRRQSRERQALEMNSLKDHSEANLARVAPILDEAINKLGAADRTAIVLRFFEQQDFRSIGDAMGSNEAAAQKRVSRALEKLHSLLKRRGVALSVAALGTALAGEAVSAAPVGLAAGISTTALASASAGAGATFTLLKIMTSAKLNLGIIAVVLAVAATSLLIQHQSNVKVRADNEALRRQIAQLQDDQKSLSVRHLPRLALSLKQIAPTPQAPPPEDLPATNLISRLLKGEKPAKLTREQVEGYLKSAGRNASTLLSAFRASDDAALLEEAMEKFPNDPRVALAALAKAGSTPEEQRQWLNTFEQSDPNNALANYLSAANYFKTGQTDQAVQELLAAAGKPQFQDYARDEAQSDVEAFLASGYSVADAKMIGPTELTQGPELSGLRDLGQNMVWLANAYQQSGDPASAQTTLQMTVSLGQRMDASDSTFLIDNLIGMNIERSAFDAMNPASSYGASGQTVQDQVNQLTQERSSLKELGSQFDAVQPAMTDQDWINYRDRELAFGQTAAQHWAIAKLGQP